MRKKDTSSASAFSLLAQHLLLSFKEMWHAGWTIQYKNRVKENAYFSKDELNRFNLTESEVIDFFSLLFMNQREEQSNDVLMKIKLEVMTSFIISAREYYLSHVARYLGEQNAEPIAKQDALYSKYILMLYHKVLVVYKDRATSIK